MVQEGGPLGIHCDVPHPGRNLTDPVIVLATLVEKRQVVGFTTDLRILTDCTVTHQNTTKWFR